MKKGNKTLLIILILAGLLIRLYLMQQQGIIETDTPAYISIAENLFSGNGYIDNEGYSNLWFAPLFPILIGIGGFFSSNLELVSRLVSVIFGTGLIYIVYLLFKEFYHSEKYSLVAAGLVAFYPVLTYISVVAYPDSVYTLITILSIFVIYLTIKNKNIMLYISTGILVGLAYLTRQEGAVYLLIFLFLNFVFNYKDWKKILKYSVITILVFLILISPYLIYLHNTTGETQLTGKVSTQIYHSQLRDYTSVYELDYEKSLFKLNHDKTDIRANFYKDKETGLKYFVSKEFLSIYYRNLVKNIKLLLKIFPIPLMILSLIGIFTLRFRKSLTLSLFLIFPILFYPIFFVDQRYLVTTIPILLIFLLGGVLFLYRKFLKSLNKNLWNVGIAIVLILLLLSSFLIPILLEDKYLKGDLQEEQRQAGIDMRSFPKGAMLSRKPWIAFYSDNNLVQMPYATYNDTLEYARFKKVKYLVIDERYIQNLRPQLRFLLNGKDTEDLRLVYSNDNFKYKVLVYELK